MYQDIEAIAHPPTSMLLVFLRFRHRVYTTGTSFSLQPSMELACARVCVIMGRSVICMFKQRGSVSQHTISKPHTTNKNPHTLTSEQHSSKSCGEMSSSFCPGFWRR